MTHFIYIPGLGDRFDVLRRIVLRRWRRDDVRVTFVPMRWNDKSETYEQKYARVAKTINSVKDDETVLIGESAGGAMALLALSRNTSLLSSVVTICGYNRGASDIAPYRRNRHRALYPLLVEVDVLTPQLSLRQRQKVTTIFSTRDRTVTPNHSILDKAQQFIFHTPGHLVTIAWVLMTGIEKYISRDG